MKIRQYIIPLLCVAFLLTGVAIDFSPYFAPDLADYTKTLTSYLHQQEAKIYQLVNEKDRLERIIKNDYANVEWQKSDMEWLEALPKLRYSFHIYFEDSLVYWSNNHVNFIPQYKNTDTVTTRFVQLSDGYYELIQYPLVFEELGTHQLYGLIPIKYAYSIRTNYLAPAFLPSRSIPTNIQLSTEEITDYALMTSTGERLCYLVAEGKLQDKRYAYLVFFLYTVGFLLLGFWTNEQAVWLVKKRSLMVGASFLITSIAVIKVIASIFFSGCLTVLAFFKETAPDFIFGNSLGDFMMNIMLLLWVVLFIHKNLEIPIYRHLSYTKRFGLVFLNAFGIVFVLVNVAAMLKQLIFYSNISFDFNNVFNLDVNSSVAICGIVLLLMSLFLISHLLMMAVLQTDLLMHHRFGAYILAMLMLVPLHWYYDIGVSLPIGFLFLVIFLFLFDLFIENDTNNLIWLVCWLVILSGFAAGLLYNYNSQKEATRRLYFAQQLSEPVDTIAEQLLVQLAHDVFKDSTIYDYRYNVTNVSNDDFYSALDLYYFDNSYLYNNYEYQSHFSSENIDPQADNLPIDKTDRETQIHTFVDEQSTLYHINPPKKQSYYLLKMPLFMGTAEQPYQWWYLKFFSKKREVSKVYSELLGDQDYKNLHGLYRYDYAVYKNNVRINATSDNFSYLLSSSEWALPEQYERTETVSDNGVLTSVYRGVDKYVVLKRNMGGYTKALSLFSFVFALTIFCVLILGGINLLVPILPQTLNFSVVKQTTLRGRIQFYVIALIVISFVLIGVVTVVYFSNSHEEYHENRLGRKTDSVIKNAEHLLGTLIQNYPSTQDLQKAVSQDTFLNKIDIEAIAKIHRMDVSLYNRNGVLVKSSEKDVFRKGIDVPLMNALAYQQLARLQSSRLVQDDEVIGQLQYKAAYVPIKALIKDREQTLGYLGLPYYSRQSKLREDVTVFMGTLLNVYVFLLIIAGFIAIGVANSITRPISVLGEKLKEFKIGKRNEILEWNTNDELGALIDDYNRMVMKVKEGADLIAKSERDAAWREMAKQVAHEIKNPLTPMKLSIQYLQHAYRSNPDNIEPLLKRVSSTLIEQIDNLAQIASEFSNFAKMPRAENQRILLNQLVTSVYDLFKEHRDIQTTLTIPEDDYYVYADKNHLIRVFNNLIKNAIQAIPDGRQGSVDVRMYTEKGKILVEVKDNGTGISDEMRTKVFVPNFTTKNSGTGLGLAIAKNIIESVNGEIYFKTAVGKGTSFFVKFPIIDVQKKKEELVDV